MRLQNNVMARHGSSAAERWHEGGAGREVSGRREGNAPAAVSTPGGWDFGRVRAREPRRAQATTVSSRAAGEENATEDWQDFTVQITKNFPT